MQSCLSTAVCRRRRRLVALRWLGHARAGGKRKAKYGKASKEHTRQSKQAGMGKYDKKGKDKLMTSKLAVARASKASECKDKASRRAAGNAVGKGCKSS